jgi:hypothetical protein
MQLGMKQEFSSTLLVFEYNAHRSWDTLYTNNENVLIVVQSAMCLHV